MNFGAALFSRPLVFTACLRFSRIAAIALPMVGVSLFR